MGRVLTVSLTRRLVSASVPTQRPNDSTALASVPSPALHPPPDMIQVSSLVAGTQVFVSGVFICATWGVWKLFIRPWFSPLRRIPGPESKSFFWGNVLEPHKAENIAKVWEAWFADFGHVFVAKGFFNVRTTQPPPKKNQPHC